jgi:hypothetical protein
VPQQDRGEGVSVTYDVNSDTYVVATQYEDYPAIEAIGAVSPYVVGQLTVLYGAPRSFDYPMIACNSPYYTGYSATCILAWIGSDPYTTLQYVRGTIDQSKSFVVVGSVGSIGNYIGWQPPSVFGVPSVTYPFVTSFKQGNILYSVRYSASAGDWMDERVAYWPGPNTPGLLAGALGYSYSGQLMLQFLIE